MGSVQRETKQNASLRAATLTGLALSLTVGGALYFVTSVIIAKDAERRFDNMTRNVQAILNSRVKSYADVLRGTAGLFLATGDPSPEQFHRYVAGLNLETEFPGIETVNFARHFTDAERPAFETFMRQHVHSRLGGYPSFRIQPAGRRPEYTVLTYIEPINAGGQHFGKDLQALPSVALALAHSRDTGIASTSGTRVRLRSSASGLGMRLPVYRPGMPLRTQDERRRAYVGSVGIGFGVDRLVQGVLEGLPVRSMRLIVSGMSPHEQPGGPPGEYRRTVFFDNLDTLPASRSGAWPLLSATLPVGIDQRGWLAEFSIARADLHSQLDLFLPWLAMLAGGVSTGLLFALFHTLTSSRARALEFAEDMTRELRSSEAKLQQSNEHLRMLAAHAENIKEGERKRIAREIHDDLGQNLLALRIEADLLASRTGARHPRLHARARRTLQHIDATIKSVRQIINDLRPNVLDLGLSAAVEWQVREFRRRTDIECELTETPQDMQVGDSTATALFRILQESLTNVVRHAHASRVRIELRADGDWITMVVADNGVGIQHSGRNKAGSFGLVGVEERVKMLGGMFYVSGTPGVGTLVRVSIPLDASVGPKEAPPAVSAALPETI